MRIAAVLEFGAACVLALVAWAEPAAAAEEYADPDGLFAWTVPKRWKLETRTQNDEGPVTVFRGWIGLPDGDVPHAALSVYAVPGNSRAGLALGARHDSFGTDVPGSYRSGEGFAESARRGLASGVTAIRRFVEKDGVVVCAEFLVADALYDANTARILGWLDTVRVTGRPPVPPPGAGWRAVAEPAYDLWTDGDPESKPFRETQKLIREAWGAAGDAFAEKPWPGLRFRFLLHATDASFDAARGTRVVSSYAWLETGGTAHVALRKAGDGRFAAKVRVAAASLAVRTHFGGEVPCWIDRGISTWAEAGLEADGKPAKPKAARVSHARNAVKAGGDRTLPAIVDAGWTLLDERGDAEHEAWAWHSWFRHGSATEADRALYARSLAELRERADWRASRAVWGESDAERTADRFRAWLARWK